MSVNSGPNTRDGKPINVGDQATLVGFVTAIGPQAGNASLVTLTMQGSGLSIQVQCQDVAASTQTL